MYEPPPPPSDTHTVHYDAGVASTTGPSSRMDPATTTMKNREETTAKQLSEAELHGDPAPSAAATQAEVPPTAPSQAGSHLAPSSRRSATSRLRAALNELALKRIAIKKQQAEARYKFNTEMLELQDAELTQQEKFTELAELQRIEDEDRLSQAAYSEYETRSRVGEWLSAHSDTPNSCDPPPGRATNARDPLSTVIGNTTPHAAAAPHSNPPPGAMTKQSVIGNHPHPASSVLPPRGVSPPTPTTAVPVRSALPPGPHPSWTTEQRDEQVVGAQVSIPRPVTTAPWRYVTAPPEANEGVQGFPPHPRTSWQQADIKAAPIADAATTPPPVPPSTQRPPLKLLPPTPLHREPAAPDAEDSVSKAIMYLGAKQSLYELPNFDGTSGQWYLFAETLHDLINNPRLTDRDVLARLQKSLHGRARDAVSSLIGHPANLRRILSLLEDKFGSPIIMISESIDQITAFPRIFSSTYRDKLRDLSTLVSGLITIAYSDSVSYFSTERNTNIHTRIEDESLLAVLENKLPDSLCTIWWARLQCDSSGQPPIRIFDQWLEETAQAMPRRYVPRDAIAHECKQPAMERRSVPRFSERARAQAAPRSARVFQAAVSQNRPITIEVKACELCSSDGHQFNACPRLAAMTTGERFEAARRLEACFRCLITGHRGAQCRKFKRHTTHPLLRITKPTSSPALTTTEREEKPKGETVGCINSGRQVLLKIVPVVLRGPGGTIETSAFLDDGSAVTLINHEIADKLKLHGPTTELTIRGISGALSDDLSRQVQVNIRGVSEKREYQIEAKTIRNLQLPRPTPLRRDVLREFAHLKKIYIGEPREPVGILIGQDNWELIVGKEIRRGNVKDPAASRTPLGWCLHGQWSAQGPRDNTVMYVGHTADVTELIRRHVGAEEAGVIPRRRDTPTLLQAEKTMRDTTKRVDEQRWETGLLWKNDEVCFPPSKRQAEQRLQSIERKMRGDAEYAAQYREKMQRYLDRGYARKLTPAEVAARTSRTFYLPHFAVNNPNKPNKIRVVFDAAARSAGAALNDKLLSGPDMMNSLLGCIFRFRQGAIAFTADIEEMFLRIKIREEDQQAQRFLWRPDPTQPHADEYVMTSLLFGATSSPCSAQYVKNRNAEEDTEASKRVKYAIIRNHYVDDLLDSTDSIEQAQHVINGVRATHAKGGFNITGWAASDERALRDVPPPQRSSGSVTLAQQESPHLRTLGLQWSPREDHLTFDLSMKKVEGGIADGSTIPTKREVLRVVMSVFDPVGILSPITVKSKILLQKIWRSEVEWDTPIGNSEYEGWRAWLAELETAKTVEVPRHYFAQNASPATRRELHVFADASGHAYAAVAYFLTKYADKNSIVSFVAAKTRVAPTKTISVPRLELSAALLAARLADTVRAEHDVEIHDTIFWSDSQTVLGWIASDKMTYKAYVAHRLAEIDELEARNWRYVPTKMNVADEATRDAPQADLTPGSRWLSGPPFLREPPATWPTTGKIETPEDERVRETHAVDIEPATPTVIDVTRFSNYARLLNATAYVHIFIQRCRKLDASLTVAEMQRAERTWYKWAQRSSFTAEVTALQNGQALTKRNRLIPLSPYLDEHGVLRSEGRVKKEAIQYDTRNPIILHARHPFTQLLIRGVHKRLQHEGMDKQVNVIRTRYYIFGLRAALKKIKHTCATCKINRAQPEHPKMGNLPEERLTYYTRPFTKSGMDYFGPMEVTIGRRQEKRWGVIFTCLTTRAVHLEIAESLSTDSCIQAIRRFAARRGTPQVMYSDNGTNMVGADHELRRSLRELEISKVKENCRTRAIEFKFNPPSCPWAGGAWERLIRAIKIALRATMCSRAPRPETLQTLFAEAEFLVNTRPLTHVSLERGDEESLTPNHFLLGSSTGDYQVPGDFSTEDLRKQWRIAQTLIDQFWKRWLQEYLPTLLARQKWHTTGRAIRVGDVVLIADKNQPRASWTKGVVTTTHPGRDGIARTVEIKTATGSLRRPVGRLAVIYENNID